MNRCPYLGITDDPQVHFAFPAPENGCHKPDSVEAIPLEHQGAYCLSDAHTGCPIYHGEPARAALREKLSRITPAGRPAASRRPILGALLLLLLAASLIGFALFLPGIFGGPAAGRNALPTQAPGVQASGAEQKSQSENVKIYAPQIALAGAEEDPTPTGTPLPTHTPTAQPSPTPTLCAPPGDWVAYTTRPGDSLAEFRRIYDLTKARLMAANCLQVEDLEAGQVIYLPYPPPDPTPTSPPLPQAPLPNPTKAKPPAPDPTQPEMRIEPTQPPAPPTERA